MDRPYLLHRDPEDLRDRHFCSLDFRTPGMLPAHADLRLEMSPVVDQGHLGSCTANAIASGLKEYWLNKTAQWTQLSRLYLYYHERVIEGRVGEDSGASIRVGMKVLQKLGVCPERDWPYDPKKFADEPVPIAELDAEQYRILSYSKIRSLALMRAALASGQPVVFGMEVYAAFESARVARTGKMTMPRRGERMLGGHAVLAVGYDDAARLVIVRNSWGPEWGDKGYFYLPYGYWENLVFDMWTGE